MESFLCLIFQNIPEKKELPFSLLEKFTAKNFIKSLLLLILIIILFLIYFNKILYLIFILCQFVFIILFIIIFRTYSNKKINGVTGDVLGAAIELLELFFPAITIILFVVINS